jgi:hypothetical protein
LGSPGSRQKDVAGSQQMQVLCHWPNSSASQMQLLPQLLEDDEPPADEEEVPVLEEDEPEAEEELLMTGSLKDKLKLQNGSKSMR